MRKTICLDFDGVIHSYERGWEDGKIYGHVLPGFFEWAVRALPDFNLAIFSTRSATEEGRGAMRAWLAKELAEWKKLHDRRASSAPLIQDFAFPSDKPPAVLIIDDRAIRFKGDWAALELSLEALQTFYPWNTTAKASGQGEPR